MTCEGQQIETHLKILLDRNGKYNEKLRSLTDENQLSPSKAGTASAKMRLKEILQEAKQELEDADRQWDGLKSSSKSTVRIYFVRI